MFADLFGSDYLLKLCEFSILHCLLLNFTIPLLLCLCLGSVIIYFTLFSISCSYIYYLDPNILGIKVCATFFCVQCSIAYILTVDFVMCVLYKIKYIIHGSSVIILTQFFEPCYTTTCEVYIVGCNNFRKKNSPVKVMQHIRYQGCVCCVR